MVDGAFYASHKRYPLLYTGRQKKAYLEDLGLEVHELWEVPLEEKGISGKDVRNLIVKGAEWEYLVPKSVIEFIKENDIIRRLKALENE